ncbi:cyclic nucleotide-binding domain-containing protein [Flavobacterium sp. D11R37]|uniref:Crp/Fnr family transcriptional regulator n=1 Tax=Flavobacterium coralii TaxID=2838017 RepID=UPI001CA74034|nr:cyclic nucleotide-binding domain-containing protein [Flavobacterium coralii]MBY8961316.1 cyclic nucleotide-binding domain-containing protein [Flavobacterium coralii]
MKEFLEAHIRKRLGENPENLDFVLGHFEPLTVAKNELILTSGKTCSHIYFIVSGCLQVFVHDDDMNENIRDLIIEDNWCSELHSLPPETLLMKISRLLNHASYCASVKITLHYWCKKCSNLMLLISRS